MHNNLGLCCCLVTTGLYCHPARAALTAFVNPSRASRDCGLGVPVSSLASASGRTGAHGGMRGGDEEDDGEHSGER